MKKLVFIALIFLGLVFFWPEEGERPQNQLEKTQPRIWQVKSIDTMKYSRDLAGEKLNDPTFDATINLQVKSIKQTGATHVAIGTPYDGKFTPFLKRWVKAARDNGLKVWFRGNFSVWEGWFGYRKDLTRDEHLALVREFINNNGSLFENGDLFSPCPECENGGPGDPRHTGDVEGFRQFMIEEFQASNVEFRKIGKNVRIVGSMNFDVAKLVMDEATANAVGNLVVIDHYVKSPQDLAGDINKLAIRAKANVMLGELGVPIPDIHGKLSEGQQADWLDQALSQVAKEGAVIGLNYWTSFGGSTAIFNNNGSEKPAAKILGKYYTLEDLSNL